MKTIFLLYTLIVVSIVLVTASYVEDEEDAMELRQKPWRTNANTRLTAAPTVRREAIAVPSLELLDDDDTIDGIEIVAMKDRGDSNGADESYSNEAKIQRRIQQFIPEKMSKMKYADIFGVKNDLPVVCPDKESLCPSETTCCPLDDQGVYGCCPSPQAVCCSDKIHCCPHGTTCDTAQGMCNPSGSEGGSSTRLLKKLPSSSIIKKPAMKTEEARVKCNSAASSDRADSAEENEERENSCPSGSTCCYNNGVASCCPRGSGVCCAPKRLSRWIQLRGGCCPDGFSCTPSGLCQSGWQRSGQHNFGHFTFSRQIFAAPRRLLPTTTTLNHRSSKVTTCSDGSSCDGHSTCCPVRNAITQLIDSYRCCKLSKAVCCGVDADFCCPLGYTCGREQRCERGYFLDVLQ